MAVESGQHRRGQGHGQEHGSPLLPEAKRFWGFGFPLACCLLESSFSRFAEGRGLVLRSEDDHRRRREEEALRAQQEAEAEAVAAEHDVFVEIKPCWTCNKPKTKRVWTPCSKASRRKSMRT